MVEAFRYFGLSDADVPCLNLLEPAALLRFPGDGEYGGEYFENRSVDWDATQIEVRWGWTTDVGDWALSTG